ncbi:MAG: SDR family oxidoreductase [Sphingobium sp.]
MTGRAALVTGSSRGIGRAIALRLARDGADIAVHYNRDADAAQETVAAIKALGRRAVAYAASMEDRAQLAGLAEAVTADFGPVSILVLNAGIASRGHGVADTDPDEFERVMRVHAFAPHHLARLFLPALRTHARSDIVIVSSIATHQHHAGSAPSVMGKAAAEALARILSKEEMPHGVRTNIVAPGLTVTDMGARLARHTRGVAIEALDGEHPFGHVARPDDVAAVVAFLVSDDAAYVNGQRIHLEGFG